VATANNRATDSDPTVTCEVLGSALSQDQPLRSPARGTRRWFAAALVLVLLAAGFAGGLSGCGSSKNSSNPGAVPASSTTPQAPPNLLTANGLSGLLAQMRTKFGDTMGYQLTVRPDSAVLSRPDSTNSHNAVDWQYGKDGWKNMGASSIPPDSTVSDLGKFDVQEVTGVVNAAPQTLHLDNPTNTSLTIESQKDGSLALEIELSNDSKSGSIDVGADGTVKQLHPPSD
jgi:hypothetical protein